MRECKWGKGTVGEISEGTVPILDSHRCLTAITIPTISAIPNGEYLNFYSGVYVV